MGSQLVSIDTGPLCRRWDSWTPVAIVSSPLPFGFTLVILGGTVLAARARTSSAAKIWQPAWAARASTSLGRASTSRVSSPRWTWTTAKYVSSTASAYFSEVDGRVLSWSIEGDVLTDAETGSEWSDAGLAISGPIAGLELVAVPSRTSLWVSLVGALPGIELYQP